MVWSIIFTTVLVSPPWWINPFYTILFAVHMSCHSLFWIMWANHYGWHTSVYCFFHNILGPWFCFSYTILYRILFFYDSLLPVVFRTHFIQGRGHVDSVISKSILCTVMSRLCVWVGSETPCQKLDNTFLNTYLAKLNVVIVTSFIFKFYFKNYYLLL